MKKRCLFLMLVAGAVIWGFGALEARAGSVPLPTTLDQLLVPGAFTVTGLEPDTFANFTYSASPVGSPPAAADITVKAFSPGAPESGITFTGAFFAAAGTTVDYAISYTVTAPKGETFTDATLSGVFSTFGGTGAGSVGETIFKGSTAIGTMEIASPPGSVSDTIPLGGGANTILVEKDIVLVGGSNGASLSFVNQGYSSTVIPEPASMALLGIGISGLIALRRFFKRPSVA
jgi:hypothetical protein